MQLDSTPESPRWQTWAIHLMFFSSGAASLICQVVWSKQLQHVLGSSTFSVSVTVASFFLGLSIGSLLGGWVADRSRRLLWTYCLLELLLGGVALSITWLLADWMAWVGWLAPLLAVDSSTARPLTVLLAFLVLLPPASLMGATLPLLAKHLVRERSALAHKVGLLYGINTLGAATGCALVGFVLIGLLGVFQSALVATAVYVLVAVTAGALALSERTAPAAAMTAEPAEPPAAIDPLQARILVGIFGLSGFVAVAYEVIWFRLLVNTGVQAVYAFAGMLTIYLLGLVLGALICARYLAPRKDTLLVNFARVQLLIALACVVTLALLGQAKEVQAVLAELPNRWLPTWAIEALGDVGGFMLLCAVVLLVPSTLIGIGFPLASELTVQHLSGLGGRLGLLYSCNTLGGVAGSLAAGFLLLPLLGSQGSLILMAAANVGLFVLIVATQPALRSMRVVWREGALAGLAAAAGFLFLGPDYLKRELTFHATDDLLAFRETADATFVVLGHQVKNGERFQQLVVNGRSYANNILPGRRYMGMLAHLPTLLHRQPEQALVICVGTGTTVGSMTTHEGLRGITAVDLCREVFDVAPLFVPLNQSFHTNPKVKQVTADGRHFLLTTDETFDVLTFEPPPPNSAGVVNLYSQEFYQLAKTRMRPGAVLAQWAPLDMPRPILSKIMLRAMCEEFPYVSFWLPNSMQGIAIASMEPLRIDVAQLRARMAEPKLRADLHQIGIDSAEDLLATFVASGDELQAYLGDAPTVTDDRPRLEYFNLFPAGDNTYEQMVQLRQPVEPYLVTPPTDAAALRQARAVCDAIWHEHKFANTDLADTDSKKKACQQIRAGLLLAPDNAYLKSRLSFLETQYLDKPVDGS